MNSAVATALRIAREGTRKKRAEGGRLPAEFTPEDSGYRFDTPHGSGYLETGPPGAAMIYEFSAADPTRSGNGRKLLQWLGGHFNTLGAQDIGQPGTASHGFWRRMAQEGHVKDLFDERGKRIALLRKKKRATGGEIENKNHPDYGITSHERAPDHEYEPEPFNLDAAPKQHTGAISSKVSGRTDHLPMHVPSGSHVLPADVVSALGEGNTASGFRIVKDLFAIPNRMKGMPFGAEGLPYGATPPGKAAGGRTKGVPIIAAGGEHVLTPEEVEHVARRFGSEDRDDGHAILDEFIKQVRKNNIKTLKGLPGPAKD